MPFCGAIRVEPAASQVPASSLIRRLLSSLLATCPQALQQVRAVASRLEGPAGGAAAAEDGGVDGGAGKGRRSRAPARSTATRRHTTRQAAVELQQEDGEEVMQPTEDAGVAGEREATTAEEVPVADAIFELLQPLAQQAAAPAAATTSRRARSTRSVRGTAAGRATAGEEVEQQQQQQQLPEDEQQQEAAPARKRGRPSSARSGKKEVVTTVVRGGQGSFIYLAALVQHEYSRQRCSWSGRHGRRGQAACRVHTPANAGTAAGGGLRSHPSS